MNKKDKEKKKEDKQEKKKIERIDYKEKVNQQKKEIDDLINTLKRVQAEFENYKKRVEKEKEEFSKYVIKDFIIKLLPFLDSFELALNNKSNKEEFVKGIEMIYSQLFSTLEQMGLKKLDVVGKKFDPYKHEALLSENSDKEEGTILEELQKGYTLNGVVIRPTKVKISKKGNK